MMKKILVILILVIIPTCVFASGEVATLGVEPGILPGQSAYWLKRMAEWLQVNIFTVRTKAKQAKELMLAEQRLAELQELLNSREISPKALDLALKGYQSFLRKAEDMTEKIIILDGNQIYLAENFEKSSRKHEVVLGGLLLRVDPKSSGWVQQALAEARIENEQIFKFMVQNYQFTDQDIMKHKFIVDQHLRIVERGLQELSDNNSRRAGIRNLIQKSREFQKAGLNLQAYDFLKRAKNLEYSRIP